MPRHRPCSRPAAQSQPGIHRCGHFFPCSDRKCWTHPGSDGACLKLQPLNPALSSGAGAHASDITGPAGKSPDAASPWAGGPLLTRHARLVGQHWYTSVFTFVGLENKPTHPTVDSFVPVSSTVAIVRTRIVNVCHWRRWTCEGRSFHWGWRSSPHSSCSICRAILVHGSLEIQGPTVG